MERKFELKPLTSEKAYRLLEENNTLTFIVSNRKITKTEIKNYIKKVFNAKVAKVNTLITPKGYKKAYVKFEEPGKAQEIAKKLGLL